MYILEGLLCSLPDYDKMNCIMQQGSEHTKHLLDLFFNPHIERNQKVILCSSLKPNWIYRVECVSSVLLYKCRIMH